jgi:tryptophan synthase alpha chain
VSRIAKRFAQLKSRRETALIGYLTAGYPKAGSLPDYAEAFSQAGLDLLEVGIPFSDPLADGPTIQAASQIALANGSSVRSALRQVAQIRRKNQELPLVFMTYLNPILSYGLQAFCSDAVRAGADGLIIPDLPPEEAAEVRQAARKANLDTIFLAAPTSTSGRMKKIVRDSRGFIYYVSLTGVTGARAKLPASIGSDVRRLKRKTRLPVCVGFGVSKPDQVRRLARVADGVIVGSALLNVIQCSKGKGVREGARFIRRLKRACR